MDIGTSAVRHAGWWLVFMALLPCAARVQAQSLSDMLLKDVADGRLDQFDFFTAALIAGGVDEPAELTKCRDDYRQRRGELLARLPHKRLEAIHAAMHLRFLTGGYQHDASDVRRTLARGEYNCLTALVIYVDLCRAAGLDIEIW